MPPSPIMDDARSDPEAFCDLACTHEIRRFEPTSHLARVGRVSDRKALRMIVRTL